MSSLGSPSHCSPYSHDQLDGVPPHNNSHRKRVGKACDRCRLKKSKCDGSNPCHRCNQADHVCTFTERKRPKGRVYPDGYVEILESKCQVLIGGLIELDRLRKNLPPPKTLSTAGLASGKLANQILKEIGINTTLTDSDIEDEDDGHEHGYYHDDEEFTTSATGSPEPTGDGWDMLSHQMQDQQHQGHSRSQQAQWNQSHLRGSSHYYMQMVDSGLMPPSPPTVVDYNLSSSPHSCAESPYYSHLSHELQVPTTVIGPSILPPSPSTPVGYNSTRPSSTSSPYTPDQQLPHYYNGMEVFVGLSSLTPTPGEQSYSSGRYRY